MTGTLEVGGVSHRMAELACYYANRLSFEELSKLVIERVGAAYLPPRTLHRIVHRVAGDLDEQQAQRIADSADVPLPKLAETVDIYDPNAPEVVVMEDGILVKSQKPERKPEVVRPKRFIPSDVATLQLPDGRYHTVMEGLERKADAAFDVGDALRDAVVRFWGETEDTLAVVALTDGAKSIRKHLTLVFGVTLVVILDWYHLTKKLQTLLSQICHGNEHRKAVQQTMEHLMWRGDVDGALAELSKVDPRNPERATELTTYLEKHRCEIIDYGRRQKAGKPIGSGRMEKAVDQAIGHRQKRKGMSWSEPGSRGLAKLRCLEINDEWEDFWQKRAA